ncbi:hypothetical protein I5N59_24540 [Serratia marcescens]|uniref:hypothetical protein n=1 Tax=Serratia marcescens TaxID=615 RepID=UPI0018D5ACA7|nr:hypothetical protein [Serratia marcescens]
MKNELVFMKEKIEKDITEYLEKVLLKIMLESGLVKKNTTPETQKASASKNALHLNANINRLDYKKVKNEMNKFWRENYLNNENYSEVNVAFGGGVKNKLLKKLECQLKKRYK